MNNGYAVSSLSATEHKSKDKIDHLDGAAQSLDEQPSGHSDVVCMPKLPDTPKKVNRGLEGTNKADDIDGGEEMDGDEEMDDDEHHHKHHGKSGGKKGGSGDSLKGYKMDKPGTGVTCKEHGEDKLKDAQLLMRGLAGS